MAYYFELPTFTQLTNNQRLALEEDDAIALSGGPGTGKTVVSLWRHIRNHELGQRDSLLLTYTKTLEFYLKSTASRQNYTASSNIGRTYCWINNCKDNGAEKRDYDEIIIDEAQDVGGNNYDTISNYTKMVSYGADDAQSLYQDSCSLSYLQRKFSNNEDYELSQNFRNSREILEFTKSVFPYINIPHNIMSSSITTGKKPFLQELGFRNFEELVVDNIVEITEEFSASTHNIGVLLPSERQVNIYYERLQRRISCSKYYSSMEGFDSLERIHVTTFKSAKGLEFDTVIIPGFDSYDWFIENTGGTFSENDYYVALTRAKRNLFLLCKKDINISSNNTYTIE